MKILNLKLIGVKGFKELDLKLENPFAKGEPLRNIVLIGKNGSGKTTILKSIVHCLTTLNFYYGGEQMDKTDINVNSKQFCISLNVKYNTMEKKVLFNEVSPTEIENYSTITTIKKLETVEEQVEQVETNSNDYIEPIKKTIYKDYMRMTTPIEKNDYSRFINRIRGNNNKETLVFYFDSLRFLPDEYLSGPNAKELPQNNRGDMLSNSIKQDGGKNIYKYLNTKQWLINLDFKRLKNEEYENIYSRIIDAINTLISPNKFHSITENGGILFETKCGIVSIEKLSDGFKNIFIIIGEILYRFETNTDIENINEMLNKEAIILIDEIDCHLHPEWQINIIPSLNKIFPNIQIIATTHSPFIVESLQTYEVIKLGDDC